MKIRTVTLGLLLLLSFASFVVAQTSSDKDNSLPITASVNTGQVRFVAPEAAVQLHVEVFNEMGQPVSDLQVKGNVLDWSVVGGKSQQLSDGSYVCVVTAKGLNGKLVQRLASLQISGKEVELRAANYAAMTSSMQQAIGPIEGNASVTVVAPGEVTSAAVLLKTGQEAQLSRTEGALSFRLGDIYNGKDVEQMVLTEEGNLGVGTKSPQAKLDVAGAVLAEKFLRIKPGSANSVGTNSNAEGATDAANTDGLQPMVAGTGTTNRIPLWVDGPAGTLADSIITQQPGSGFVGVGTSSPTQPFQVEAGAGGPGTSRTLGFNVTGVHASNSTYSFQAVTSKGVGQFGVDTFFDSAGVGFMSTTAPGGFVFSANNNNQHLRILPTGNIGIGTASPLAKLQVTGGSVRLDNDQQLEFGGGAESVSGSNAQHSLTMWSNNQPRMTINSAGNIGMGTTGPNTTVDVNGALSMRGISAPALSPGGQGRIFFDTALNKFRVSQNAGAYTDLVGGGGSSAIGPPYQWVCTPARFPSGAAANALLSVFNASGSTANVSVNPLRADGTNLAGVAIPSGGGPTYPGNTTGTTTAVAAGNTLELTWQTPSTLVADTARTIRVTSDQIVVVGISYQLSSVFNHTCNQVHP